MSMPHPTMLFAAGCVVQVNPTRKVLIFRDEREIRRLHPFFDARTNAADILSQTASTDAHVKSDHIHLTHKSHRVASKHVIWRIRAGMKKPAKVQGPHRMQPKYYYWLETR